MTDDQDFAVASRLTLLPLELSDLGKRKLNFCKLFTRHDVRLEVLDWYVERALAAISRTTDAEGFEQDRPDAHVTL